MTDADLTYERARIGDDLERFTKSPAGRFLWNKADEHVDSAKNALAICSPLDSEKIRELQNKIQVANMFKQWVSEGIQSGDQALIQLEDVPA
ncbi:MAG: hypothetical protein KAI39_09985 [Desulfobulbaceae bacterium]|nr:hypothetical protein [Desulfobulbaceae bacterium]